MAEQFVACIVDDGNLAVAFDLECLVVGAVLFGLLRHQAHIGHAAHGGRVEGAVDLAELDHLLVDRRVGTVRNDRLHVVQLAVRSPHLARGAQRRGHRGVDDDVARHVQIGDAAVGIDHGHGRLCGVDAFDIGLDLPPAFGRKPGDAREQIAEAVVDVDTEFVEQRSMLVEQFGEIDPHRVAEDDRVRDFHHGGLQVQREQHAFRPRGGDGFGEKLPQRLATHETGVDDFAGRHRDSFLQYACAAIGGAMFDAQVARLFDGRRLFVAEEIAAAHGANMRGGIRRPCAHGMRMLARVGLDSGRGAAVGIAFPQHRVDRAALDPVVTGLDLGLALIGRLVGIVRQFITPGLQLADRGLHLRNRGGDIGQLDDVGQRIPGLAAEFGEGVGPALGGRKTFGKSGNDAPGQRNIAQFHLDAGDRAIGLDDREQ